ncbi:hypothetical protein FB45DRAFT_896685 [Roridomyces roridus]|uniref:Uncharacterized protein n=1 Tax=Roridomyces roridus TaxID=1738132 RepID=A0AAD7CAU7_9AGAR|nr:hypothetical protein FB45DRAFT_896685 [Roridomyces roridus]
MPYSISALFALPRTFVGLFFASKAVHLSTSPPVVKYTPTVTTEIFFEPSLSSPTPSDIAPFPYVVTAGLAAVTIASVAFTICSTFGRRRRRRSPIFTAAPEIECEMPPTESDTWLPWLVVLFFNIAFHLSNAVSVTKASPAHRLLDLVLYRLVMVVEERITDVVSFTHHWLVILFFNVAFHLSNAVSVTKASPAYRLLHLVLYRLAMVVEERIVDVVSFIHHVHNHLHNHGWQYLNIMLLALIGHTVGLLIFFIHHRNILPFVRRHRYALSIIFPAACSCSITFIILLWYPRFNGSPSLLYYSMTRNQYLQAFLPNIRRILFRTWLFLRSQPPGSVPMILGPAAIHLAMNFFQLVLFLLFEIRSTMRMLHRQYLYPNRLALDLMIIFPMIGAGLFAFILHSSVPSIFLILELPNLHFSSRLKTKYLPPGVLWFLNAGIQVWELYRPSLELHRRWEKGQTREIRRLARFLWNTTVELPKSQQLLVIAPIVILYGFLYIKPLVLKVASKTYWHLRRQRERARYLAVSQFV